jgi:hypothetical protein
VINLLRLEINQKFGEIGLRQRPSRLGLQQKPADFRLERSSGKLKINSRDVRVEIDQSKARAQLNSKNSKIYAKDIAQEGMRTAYQAIATYAREGDQLAAIEKGGQPVIEQAIKHASSAKKELGLKWKQGPEYRVNSGDIKIDYNLSEVNLKTRANWPKLDFKWGKIEVYQQQKSELEIRAVDVVV